MREKRQQEAVDAFLGHVDHKSIVFACPRFGKIKVAIDILKTFGEANPMIFAPRNDIEKGWKEDFEKFGVQGGYEFRTFAAIKKIKFFSHRFVIIDEPHEMSINQQKLLAPHLKGKKVLGLTGTMTNKTRQELYDNLNLDVCYSYSIDQGVSEGILADYTMYLHKVPLEDTKAVTITKSGKVYTEKGMFNLQKFLQENAHNKQFFNLKMINMLQNSEAKRLKTVELLEKSKSERTLVFCGVTKVADNLGIPVYHSKSKERVIFKDFCEGRGDNHLATIKMMQAGVTISPIKKGIINYTSGNPEDAAQKICRFLGFEYNNPLKRAEIHIISSDEPFELTRMKTALAFFNETKIITV